MPEDRYAVGRTLVTVGRTLVGSGFGAGAVAAMAAYLNGQTSDYDGTPLGPGPGPVWVLSTLAVVLLVNGGVLWLRGDGQLAAPHAGSDDT